VPDEETQGDSIRSFEGQDDDVPMAEMRALPPKRKSIDSLDIMECECGIEVCISPYSLSSKYANREF